MPTYEYSCKACNEVFDVFQSMRDAPLTNCPKCGQTGVKRLIGRGAGIIFKGSGFYETDYKKSAEPKSASESSSGGETTTSQKESSSTSATSSTGAATSPGSATATSS